MATYTPLNVGTSGQFVELRISTDSSLVSNSGTWTSTATTNAIIVPALQDITVTNSNGTFRWVTLDSASRAVVATPATNSLNLNIVLDDTSFFTGAGTTTGIFALSNTKQKVYFKFTFGGGSTRYLTGSGYLANLAPKVNPDQPVWVSPLVIEVDGNYTLV